MAGVLSRLFGRRAPETRALDWPAAFGGIVGTPGAPVSPATAEGLSAVTACIGVIASGLSSLPARVYRSTRDGRVELPDHPVARLIARPNGYQTFPEMLETWVSSALVHGNGVLQIETDSAGRAAELLPVPWPSVSPVILPSKRLALDVVGGTGQRRRLLDGEYVILRDRADEEGYIGRSRLARAGETLQAAVGLARHSAAIWDNAARPSGVVTLPHGISPEGFRRARAQFDGANTGASNAGKVVYLDKDSTFAPISVPPEQAEVLKSRLFSIQEICRIFQVPPPLVQDYANNTFTNAAQADLWFARQSLMPWARKIEAAFSRSVFTEPDLHLEIDFSGLVRGDYAARWQSYAIARQHNILSEAEIREAEGYNPRPASAAPVPAWAVGAESVPA